MLVLDKPAIKERPLTDKWGNFSYTPGMILILCFLRLHKEVKNTHTHTRLQGNVVEILSRNENTCLMTDAHEELY